MWNEATDFANYIAFFDDEPSIRPDQVRWVGSALDQYSVNDLVTIMYFGTDKQALNALSVLKGKFKQELDDMEMNEQEMATHAAHSWN
jgi:hypothetical protein